MENYLKNIGSEIIKHTIEAVTPTNIMRQNIQYSKPVLKIRDKKYNLDLFDRVFVVGAGKASAFMALELEKILGDRISGGIVVVKYGHGAPCKKVRIKEAGHPVLDENGLNATKEILELLKTTTEKDLVVCLISGGGSALLESLSPDISLSEMMETAETMLKSGATINEFNIIRKHLSLVKGGGLARHITPSQGISLVISDVIGDPLDIIASGPTYPDGSTFQEAWQILEKFDLLNRIPASVRRRIQEGLEGKIPENLKEGDPIFEKIDHVIIGNNERAVEAAAEKAAEMGFRPVILTTMLEGEAKEVGLVLAIIAREIIDRQRPFQPPVCLICGGETTVTFEKGGKGGRNQELAVSVLHYLKDSPGYLFFSVGTDGTDGPTDAAGGLADAGVYRRALELELAPEKYLKAHDTYHFLEKTGGLIKTGPTGTNVMDVMAMLIEK